MKIIMKRFLATLMLACLIMSLTACGSLKVSSKGWDNRVENAINDFIKEYGNTSGKYNKNSYVVTDFDNTTSIFDMCEQLIVYQMEVMGFGFTPDELPNILKTGLGDMNKDLSELGYGKGSYNDWIYDITVAYKYLYEKYGPFKPEGVREELANEIQKDPMWLEYAVKMMNMYNLIGDNESTDVSYPWITYWYTGMTSEELYNLSVKSHEKYRNVDTSYITLKTSEDVNSKVGVTQYEYVNGVQVTDNVVEMWKLLNESGIDMWVCSASEVDIIRAAVDVFGLHNYCKGVIGMTLKEVDGRFINEYDYDTGYAWIPKKNGTWTRGNTSSGAQVQGPGKVKAIENICVSQYGCGPLAGFMDSTGDYNFCTEFKDLKLVICYNRGNRKVTDGGGVIAELAVYQEDVLEYDLKTANANGDTLYVLQGRDENGKRTLRESRKTLRLGESEPKLFRDEKNEAQLQYMIDNKMTTEEIVNKFAVKTSMDNELGFAYGFLDKYLGYHSR